MSLTREARAFMGSQRRRQLETWAPPAGLFVRADDLPKKGERVLRHSRDGKVYEVLPSGEWRRIKGEEAVELHERFKRQKAAESQLAADQAARDAAEQASLEEAMEQAKNGLRPRDITIKLNFNGNPGVSLPYSVHLTHKPTGITAEASAETYDGARDTAMADLQAKVQGEQQLQDEEAAALR